MREPPPIVVDASVAAKWVLPEEGQVKARRLLEHADRRDILLIAPDVVAVEVANAIWLRQMRGEMTSDEVRVAFALVMELMPDVTASNELLEQAIELAVEFRHPVYDCLYVALALRVGGTLVTYDSGIVRAFGVATHRVIHLEALELVA